MVAQFSGGEELDRLSRSVGVSSLRVLTPQMNDLVNDFQNHPEAQKWWAEFKDHTLRITRQYRGREDIEKYRDMFNRGFRIFQQHRPKIDKTLDRMNVVLENIANDEMVMRLRESMAALSDDLFWQDADGNR